MVDGDGMALGDVNSHANRKAAMTEDHIQERFSDEELAFCGTPGSASCLHGFHRALLH
jgi:hypothetical protein